MNYVERFLADFICGAATRVVEISPGVYRTENPAMIITRDKIVVTENYFGVWFLSDITFEPTRCCATKWIYIARGHPKNKKEPCDWGYEDLFHYVQSRVGIRKFNHARVVIRSLPAPVAEEICGHVCVGIGKYMRGRDYHARFVAEFVIPDSAWVYKYRDFLTLSIVGCGGIRIRADEIRISAPDERCKYILTARSCVKQLWHNDKIKHAKYSDAYKAATQNFALYKCVGTFEKLVARLPQPIAEEITPHLCRGLRSFAWYAIDEYHS